MNTDVCEVFDQKDKAEIEQFIRKKLNPTKIPKEATISDIYMELHKIVDDVLYECEIDDYFSNDTKSVDTKQDNSSNSIYDSINSKDNDIKNINYPELICSLIEEIRLSSKLLTNLPEYLHTKEDGITVCGAKYYGDIRIYAMRNDKTGYPQFLVSQDGNWEWVSAKHFTTEM